MKSRTHLVLVAYTIDKTRKSMSFCDRLVKQLNIDRRIVVFNDPRLVTKIDAKGWETLIGSNTFGEFSGWQEGLDTLGESLVGAFVVFVNDTVAAHRHFSYFRRSAFVAELESSPRHALVGFIDHAPPHHGPFALAGLEVERWASTYCFALGPGALERLERKILQPDVVVQCVPGGADENRFFSDAVSPSLQAHLRWFLFAANGWYRSGPLSAESAHPFALKARCICQEFLLTARCQELGCEVRDPMRRHPWLRWLHDVAVQWHRRIRRLSR